MDSDLPYWPRSLDWNVRPVSEAEQGKFHHWFRKKNEKVERSRSPVSCAALTGLEMRTLLKGAWKNKNGGGGETKKNSNVLEWRLSSVAD